MLQSLENWRLPQTPVGKSRKKTCLNFIFLGPQQPSLMRVIMLPPPLQLWFKACQDLQDSEQTTSLGTVLIMRSTRCLIPLPCKTAIWNLLKGQIWTSLRAPPNLAPLFSSHSLKDILEDCTFGEPFLDHNPLLQHSKPLGWEETYLLEVLQVVVGCFLSLLELCASLETRKPWNMRADLKAINTSSQRLAEDAKILGKGFTET